MSGPSIRSPSNGDLALHPRAGDQVVHPVEAAEEGALAAARGADQGRDLVAGDLDRDVARRERRAVPDREALRREHGLAGADVGRGRGGGVGLGASAGRRGGLGLGDDRAHGVSASGGAAVPVPDDDGRGVHRQQEHQQDQDAARGDDLELRVGLLGVVVDLDRQRGVTARRRPSGSRRSPAAAPTISRGAVSPIARDRARIVPVRMPGRAEGRTWSRTTCQLVAPSASAAWRSELGTVRSASCVAITMTGRTSRPSVRPPAQSVGPVSPHAEPDEHRQAEDAVDDRRHARQVGDVRPGCPAEPARRGVLLEEDRRADADRDRHREDQPEQPEAADDPAAEPRRVGVDRLAASGPAGRATRQSAVRPSSPRVGRRRGSRTEEHATGRPRRQVASRQTAPKSGPSHAPRRRRDEVGARPRSRHW